MNTNKQKIIIALSAEANKGKTKTLRELYSLLINYPNSKIIIDTYPKNKTDFRLVIEINNVRVAIESKGDPNTNLKNRLKELSTQYNCDLIFCACRSKGLTVANVNDMSKKHYFYEIIFTSTYKTSNQNLHLKMNQIKAKHLLDLAQSLGII